jgi:septal ring-binding cell division protein DamX
LNTTINIKSLSAFGLAGVIALLSGCASEPSPWTKQQSPWEQRRQGSVEAPAADQYKQDLAMEQTGGEVELSYQTEQVDAYVAPAEMEPMAEESAMVMEPEPIVEAGSAEQDIMNQPADYYTVQVIASVDVDRVYKFAEQNQLSIRYVVPTVRDGVTWHVLLLDVYPDYASAKLAMEEVAATISTQPWIRKVGSVQSLMQ